MFYAVPDSIMHHVCIYRQFCMEGHSCLILKNNIKLTPKRLLRRLITGSGKTISKR